MLKFKYCECGCRGSSSKDIGTTSFWVCSTPNGFSLHRGHGSLSPLVKVCETSKEVLELATELARVALHQEQAKLDAIRKQLEEPD